MARSAPASRHLFRFDDLVYWAERGMITVRDERDGSQRRIKADVWYERAHMIGEEGKRCNFPSEREKFAKTANEMRECCAEAKSQGSPFDESVLAYHGRHRPLKKKVFSGAGLGTVKLIPPLSAVPKTKRVVTDRG